MDAWRELVPSLSGTFKIIREGEDWIGILGAEGGPAIPVRVERGVVFGEQWILVLVDVCAASQMSFQEALERNVELAVGSYGLESERLVLRAAQPIAAGADAAILVIHRLLE